jgi:hypothetical protein
MDYIVDIDIENNNVRDDGHYAVGQFIYDEKRYCSKLYVFCKSIGLAFYTTTLTTCEVPDFYIIMNVVMFLSTMNSARYEYKHYQRYGTVFSSHNEYNTWKRNQWPKSRMVFSMTELAIKIWFFIKTFPPQFDYRTTCEIGQSMFKIHILTILVLYVIITVFSMLFLVCVYCGGPHYSYQTYIRSNITSQAISVPLPIISDNNQNDECCICMDVDNIQAWLILPCGHKYHALCVSRWLLQHHTCPICRFDIRILI